MSAGPTTAAVPVLAVRAGLHEQMRAAARGSTVAAAVPLRTVEVTGVNVHGMFRPPRGGLSLLHTAHFDGVGDDPDGLRFPAACDNAAGVAAVLEAATILHQVLPDHVGLAVALLNGEEAGARGSARRATSVEPGTFVINLDGAAHLLEAAAVEAGGPARPLLARPRPRRPARSASRCGPAPCRRTTAATLPPGCPPSGSAWACPATRPRPRCVAGDVPVGLRRPVGELAERAAQQVQAPPAGSLDPIARRGVRVGSILRARSGRQRPGEHRYPAGDHGAEAAARASVRTGGLRRFSSCLRLVDCHRGRTGTARDARCQPPWPGGDGRLAENCVQLLAHLAEFGDLRADLVLRRTGPGWCAPVAAVCQSVPLNGSRSTAWAASSVS
jgi:hypothetical protein